MTVRTGHIGNTFGHLVGGVDAVEGVFGYGRTPAVCGSYFRRREHECDVPVFRDIPKDRLQDLQSLQGSTGLEALCDRSRRPVRYANQLPVPGGTADRRSLNVRSRTGVRARSESCWSDAWPGMFASRPRARSTRCSIATVWSSAPASAVHGRRARRCRAATRPNQLWCLDFKGEFKLGNGRYCYPLTASDHASRFHSDL